MFFLSLFQGVKEWETLYGACLGEMRRAGAGHEDRRWTSRYQGTSFYTGAVLWMYRSRMSSLPYNREGDNVETSLYSRVEMGDSSAGRVDMERHRGVWVLEA
jgi:hypothetical protein